MSLLTDYMYKAAIEQIFEFALPIATPHHSKFSKQHIKLKFEAYVHPLPGHHPPFCAPLILPMEGLFFE